MAEAATAGAAAVERYGLSHTALHVNQRISIPRFLMAVASDDMARFVCQAWQMLLAMSVAAC